MDTASLLFHRYRNAAVHTTNRFVHSKNFCREKSVTTKCWLPNNSTAYKSLSTFLFTLITASISATGGNIETSVVYAHAY